MNALNNAFFFVIDKIVDIQVYFISVAWSIGKTVLLVALVTAALNYAISGGGLKDSMVKIGKATAFFLIIMAAYPSIIGYITRWTFNQARDSVYNSLINQLDESKMEIAQTEEKEDAAKTRGTWGSRATKSKKVSEERDPALYFSAVLQERTYGNLTYTVVAPAAALEMVLLVAGECFNAAEYAEKKLLGSPDVGAAVKGFICGFFVILTGVFAVLEYLIAFLEYMLIAGVGIIFFPLSLWEGSRFMSEKFVGAVTGFFVKLLMSNICIFLMLYGFMSLARTFTLNNFTGEVDQIVTVIFVSLLFFYICKSAPGLAQSLLTGTPSLSATGAISAMAGAGAAAMGAAKLAGKAGGAVAGGAAKTAFGAGGALQQAGATSAAVKEKGGSIGDQAKAFMGSMAGSAGETLKAGAGDLARSLIGGRGGSGGAGGRGPGAGAGSGLNRHSQTEKFLNEKNEDGTKKTFKEQADSRRAAGTEAGIDYMAKKEARQNGGNGAAAEKEEGRQTAASGRPHGLAIEKMNAGDRAQNPAAEGKSSGSSAQAGEGPAPATEQASRHADEGKACGGSGGNGAE